MKDRKTRKVSPYREPFKPKPLVVNDCLDLESCSDCKWLHNGCCHAGPGDLPELVEDR